VIAAYVSGHGFGHSTRVAEVLREVRRRQPDRPLAIVTSAPEGLFREAISGAFAFRATECDVGLAQKGPLVIDTAGTVTRFREFVARWPAAVEAEAAWLREIGAQAVLGDIPPLAFAAAARAGVPSAAMANFSWDWIYAHVARQQAALREAAAWAAEGYRQADVLLRLPFHGDMAVFHHIEDVPLVARRPRMSRSEARRRLGWGDDKTALLSFGGIGEPAFDAQAFGRLARFRFVLSSPVAGRPPNVEVIDRPALDRAGLGYIDLVAAADAVVTKPGYGIVSDCLGAATGIVYTERGDFPEYPILVEQMAQWLPCAYVSNEQLRTADIEDALDAVVDRPVPPPPDLDGARAVAERLLALATSRATPARSSRTS
jgi:hypothetical protein